MGSEVNIEPPYLGYKFLGMRLGGGSKYLLIMICIEQRSSASHDSLLLGALGDESEISDFPFT